MPDRTPPPVSPSQGSTCDGFDISGLQRALAEGEFCLHYQPKVDLPGGEISGFEALMRWNHPTLGMVLPVEFIPLLERSGLIVEAGRWALEEACRQVRDWAVTRPGFQIAVNLSALQLQDEGLVDDVAAILSATGLHPRHLELELTETVLMRDPQRATEVLRRLRDSGVRISIDDFGTGYSSLSYLKRFPIDAVKIDKSFIDGITSDPNDALLTRAMIAMMHDLHLKVIAEGVETEGQLAMLLAARCDAFQGFFFSRPLPATEAAAVLASGRRVEPGVLAGNRAARTLLLVDDEENVLASLKRLLRRDGYRILTASSGAEGLEILACNTVDVIVSDHRMPHMTGVEFLRRASRIHPGAVRLMLSGYAELQAVTGAINDGAVYKFLTKPWDEGQLRASIDEAFRRVELDQENRQLRHQVQVAGEQLAAANIRIEQLLAEGRGRGTTVQIARDENAEG
jgi:EAL domain-containing protein (putative c-di-GMP-specific phosphodiesterase class I)/CheY-like chemotaxis protein